MEYSSFPFYTGCPEYLDSQSDVIPITLPNTDNYTKVYCDKVTNGGRWTVEMEILPLLIFFFVSDHLTISILFIEVGISSTDGRF